MIESTVSTEVGVYRFLPQPENVRLIATDMDGTLLDTNGAIPSGFWPILDELQRRGITFVVASGRQYHTLVRLFEGREQEISFIAENGTHVVHKGAEFSTSPIRRSAALRIIEAVRSHVDQGHDLGAVWCGGGSAYVERTDAAFLREADLYYARLATVDRFEDAPEDALKLAIFATGSADDPELKDLRSSCAPCQVVVSAQHWIDIMPPDINKGVALAAMQHRLSITPDETVVFGDYLNDLEMLDVASNSFAMANAHPEVRVRARYVAPPNSAHGVLRVLAELVDNGSLACADESAVA